MSGSLAVTWQELQSASQQIQSQAADINGKLAQLKAKVDGLGGSWQGAASQSYNQLYSNWNTSAKQLFESLNGIAQMLSQAATAYEQTEQQLKSGFSG